MQVHTYPDTPDFRHETAQLVITTWFVWADGESIPSVAVYPNRAGWESDTLMKMKRLPSLRSRPGLIVDELPSGFRTFEQIRDAYMVQEVVIQRGRS